MKNSAVDEVEELEELEGFAVDKVEELECRLKSLGSFLLMKLVEEFEATENVRLTVAELESVVELEATAGSS